MTTQRVLTVEQYGEVLACLLHFASEGVGPVLAAFGLDEAIWSKNDARWVHALAESKARGQALVAMRFASAHGRARKRLARGELDLVGAARASGLVGEAAAGAPVRGDGASREERKLATPSFMKEGAPPPAAMEPAAEPAVAPEPGAAAPGRRVRATAPTTTEIPVGASADGQLPFRAGVPGQAPPAAIPAAPRQNSGTLLVDEDEAAKPATALPYPIDHYAALVVELRKPSANRAEVLARYRIGGEEQLTRLQGLFRQVFFADPSVRARYEALVMRYMAEGR